MCECLPFRQQESPTDRTQDEVANDDDRAEVTFAETEAVGGTASMITSSAAEKAALKPAASTASVLQRPWVDRLLAAARVQHENTRDNAQVSQGWSEENYLPTASLAVQSVLLVFFIVVVVVVVVALFNCLCPPPLHPYKAILEDHCSRIWAGSADRTPTSSGSGSGGNNGGSTAAATATTAHPGGRLDDSLDQDQQHTAAAMEESTHPTAAMSSSYYSASKKYTERTGGHHHHNRKRRHRAHGSLRAASRDSDRLQRSVSSSRTGHQQQSVYIAPSEQSPTAGLGKRVDSGGFSK